MKRILASAAIALALSLGGVGLAAATGQPGAPTNTCGPQNTVTPGSSAMAKGSPFNADGQAGLVYAGNPDTASFFNSNSAFSVSQYDVACVQLSH